MPHVQPTALPDLLAILDCALRIALEPISPESLHPQQRCDLERLIHRIFAWAADTFFASFLSHLLEHTDFEARVIAAKRAHTPGGWRLKQRRRVTLTLLAGHLVTLPVRAGKPVRRGRKRIRRGRATGHQATPALEVLGFVRRCSAALCLEHLEAAASLESHDRARHQLARRGLEWCKSSWLRDIKEMGSLAQQAHQAWLDAPSRHGPLGALSAAGRRIVLGFDGGRLRERCDKPGRKKSHGYRNVEAPWVEPRQLVVYAIDEQGKLEPTFGKVALASLQEPDALFERIRLLFQALRLDEAREVVIAADGQHWQWVRLRQAVLEAGVDPTRLTEVLDQGHALSRVHEIAQVPASWTQAQRVRWYLEAKTHLKAGRVEQVEAMCKRLARGRRSKAIKSLSGYFIEHRERMRYADVERRKLPKGSGGVESMIRQVLNMRLKGCGKFWKRDHAERMLLLRSWFVTGRLEARWRWTLRHRVSWWYDVIEKDSCGAQADAA